MFPRPLVALGTAAALALLGCASSGAAAAAPAAEVSTPPVHGLLVDVVHETIGGLRLDAASSLFVRRLGIPDFVGRLESPGQVEMVWARSADPQTAWATAALAGPASAAVVQLRYAGLFRTVHGDRRGTSLNAFLRHWRASHPSVSKVHRGGKVIELNVALGRVVFGFGTAGTLQAVGLAPAARAPALCVVPATCVITRTR